MARQRRWDPCIAHRDEEVGVFIDEYFATEGRSVLLIGGAGFDPRSTVVARRLSATGVTLRALFLQERRPDPDPQLVERATANAEALTGLIADSSVEAVDIFGPDNAVIGGRNMVRVLNGIAYDGVTDVIVDTSALSIGTSFPIIRFLVELSEKRDGPTNVHVFVAHDPELDASIQAIPSDKPDYIHGFKGASTLDGYAAAAKLWLPQLAAGRVGSLNRLHNFVQPHDTCPILPFPATNPRLGDILAEEFMTELESGWEVDTRALVYAAEEDPIDLYRTILRLDDLRKPVFQGVGGSLLVLSPLGSKVMALGALMAALERDLPVAHLESIGYDLQGAIPTDSEEPNLVHIWLEGDVYPKPRPALHSEGTASR